MSKKKHKHHAHQGITLSQKAQSKLSKQRKRQAITRWVGLGVIGIVVLILGVGWITQWLLPVYFPLQKTVLTVNGTNFNAGYVSKVVNIFTGGDPTYAYLYIDYALEQIEQNELMKQAADKLGITVSDQEIKDLLKEYTLDDNAATRDLVYASAVSEKLYAEHFDPLVPASGSQRQSLVMLLESAAQAEEVKARLANGEAFADIVTELSLDSTTITNKGDMDFHPAGILDGLLFAAGLDAAVDKAVIGEVNYFYDDAKSKQLGYWIIKVTERKTENDLLKAQVFGILLPTIEKAEEARQRLLDGDDFATVAKEMSQDSASRDNGGDLGLLTLGQTAAAYDTYVFSESSPLNELSQPILTKDANTVGAYWLFKVAAVEDNRTFSEDDRNTLLDTAFSDWLDEVRADPANVIEKTELTEEQRDLIAEQSSK